MLKNSLFLLGIILALAPQIYADEPDVLVVADVSPEFADLPPASPENPIYYYLVASKEKSIGPVMAGEVMPESVRIENEVVAALAKQGYIRTQVGGPRPSLVLLYTYGSASPDISDIISGDTTTDGDNPAEIEYDTVFSNAAAMGALVGLNKVAPVTGYGPDYDGDIVRDAFQSDRLYITIGALDADSLAAHKEMKLVWRTRISIDATRDSLPDVMNLMLASAGPFFGRETKTPVNIGDRERRNATVHIGEAVVVENSKENSAKDSK